jgi:acetyl esterase/lipase
MSNPAISLIDDPLLGDGSSDRVGLVEDLLSWAGDLDIHDPMVSPLFGTLDGLPPTFVYAGSLEILAPDVLLLQDKALGAGADMTFILRRGEMHVWEGPAAIVPFTTGAAFRPMLLRQLLGTDDV